MVTEETASGGWSIELWLSEGDDRASTELQRRVWEELEVEELLQGADLRVEVEGRVAMLDGTVDHYLAKVASEHAARRVEGLRGIDNRIRVLPPAALAHNDAELLAAGLRALESSALVPYRRVTLHVECGAAILGGEVTRECERAAAADLVSRLAGVTDVRNQITLRPAMHPEHLHDRVQGAVRHEHVRHVSVETRGDTIVLRGRVRSLAQRDALEHAVWSVPGVGAVRDELTIAR